MGKDDQPVDFGVPQTNSDCGAESRGSPMDETPRAEVQVLRRAEELFPLMSCTCIHRREYIFNDFHMSNHYYYYLLLLFIIKINYYYYYIVYIYTTYIYI